MAHAIVTSANGRLTAGELASTPGGQPLGVAAADALARISALSAATGNGALTLSAGLSGYRTRDDQQRMLDLHLSTVAVGTSIHGEGLAADISGLGGFAGDRHAWLRANGATCGWYQPSWAQQNGFRPEPWHWEYDPETDQNLQEDDMPYSRQELKQIIAETLRENLGDQPARSSWGPSTLAKYAAKGGAALLRSPDDLFPLVVFLDPHMRNVVREETTKVLRAEGVSGAGDAARLAAALAPLLDDGDEDLSDEELEHLHAAVTRARSRRSLA